MKPRIALRVAATLLFAASSSVAGAQLSSRSTSGGLFNTLVDWDPASEYVFLGAGDVRMSPWAAHRVQLGTVRAADPNKSWMGYYGHYQNRDDDDILGAEHSLRASPTGLTNSTNRSRTLFVPEVPGGGAAAANTVTPETEIPLFQPVVAAPQASIAPPASAANVIINPEPEAYWLVAAGLAIIAVLGRRVRRV